MREVAEKFAPLTGESIYVSGPMRGKPELNRKIFNAVTEMLWSNGALEVFNPAEKVNTGEHDNETPYAVAIREDIQCILNANAICLLPGWRASEGARFEAEIARSLNLKFYEAYKVGPPINEGWQCRETAAPTIGVEGIDQEARRLVYGARAATYGHPRGDFDIIARLWTGLLQPVLREGAAVEAEQVALMMTALKLARLAKSPEHRDSQVDTIGYMLCLARIQEDPAEIAAWRDNTD